MSPSHDVLVIGGGPGGTPVAMALARAGKRVLLVENGPGLGGTCLFEGCIPSKILRESARRLREIREAADFGLCLPSLDARVDWYAIQQRKRHILRKRGEAALARAGKLPTLELVFGQAAFDDARHAIITPHEGGTRRVSFEQAIIATGSTPTRPPIPGVDHHRVIDSETLLDIDHVPERLVVIGGGPIGVELGQIFRTFGSRVTLLEAAPRILGALDTELAERLEARMRADGIEIFAGCEVQRIDNTGDGVFVGYRDADGKDHHDFTEQVLLVTGRHPRVAGLGLDHTAVRHGRHGIEVDEHLQTSEPGLYALGDVIGQPAFAHWATSQALALARHLLGRPAAFPRPEHNSAVIFSEPELGMAGLTEAQAEAAGIDYAVARYDFAGDARAQIAGRADGLLKILYEKNGHRVIGVHALVEGADDLIGEAALAIHGGVTLEALATAIHPHPTLTEAFAQAARAALAGQT